MFDFLFGGGVFDSRFSHILLVVAVLFVVQYIARRAVGRIVEKVIKGHKYHSVEEERQREETLTSLFQTTITVAIWVVGVFIILGIFGVNLAALATGAGLVGIVVGFGIQSTVKDFLTGVFIILENQYGIGDVVTIGGQSGLVEQVTLRTTKLRDLDNSVYFVPNGEITTVKNMTLDYSGAIIDVCISYDSDIDKAKELINTIGQEMAEDPEWKDRILEPIAYLRLDSFGEYGVNLKAVGKVAPIEQWNIAGEFRTRLKKAFHKNDIEIPLPQRVIHNARVKSGHK